MSSLVSLPMAGDEMGFEVPGGPGPGRGWNEMGFEVLGVPGPGRRWDEMRFRSLPTPTIP